VPSTKPPDDDALQGCNPRLSREPHRRTERGYNPTELEELLPGNRRADMTPEAKLKPMIRRNISKGTGSILGDIADVTNDNKRFRTENAEVNAAMLSACGGGVIGRWGLSC